MSVTFRDSSRDGFRSLGNRIPKLMKMAFSDVEEFRAAFCSVLGIARRVPPCAAKTCVCASRFCTGGREVGGSRSKICSKCHESKC